MSSVIGSVVDRLSRLLGVSFNAINSTVGRSAEISRERFVFQVVLNLNDAKDIVEPLTIYIAQLFHLFLQFWQGQFLLTYSAVPYESICRANWYCTSGRCRKLLLLIMNRTVLPCKLTAGKIVTLSIETFGAVRGNLFLIVKSSIKTNMIEPNQEGSQGGLRVDGRRALELRQIRIRMGVFGQADGSAYIEHGNTKVLAAVYGPRQPRSNTAKNTAKAFVNCQYSMAVFSFTSGERKRRPRGDWKSQERSVQLRHAMEAIVHLELYPRSQIDIFVEVLQVDGSDYCASVNAATLALIDAGIPIKNYAVGCTVSLINTPSTDEEDKTLAGGVLDANFVEECSPGVTLSVVALPVTNNEDESNENGLIVVAHGTGQRLHLSRLEALKQRALQGCRDIKTILDQSVRQHLTANLLPSFLQNSLE